MSEEAKRYAVTVDERELEVAVREQGEDSEVSLNGADPIQVSLLKTSDARQYSLLLGNHSYEGRVEKTEEGWRIWVAGEPFEVQAVDSRLKGLGAGRGAAAGSKKTSMASPMPGVIVALSVAVGDQVTKGQPLLTLEAMKMRNDLKSVRDGVIKEVKVASGQTVAKGDVLVVFEA